MFDIVKNRQKGKKMNKENNSSGGNSFVVLLTLLFIGLKLTGYIDWSWWWVLSPFWIEFLIIIVVASIITALK